MDRTTDHPTKERTRPRRLNVKQVCELKECKAINKRVPYDTVRQHVCAQWGRGKNRERNREGK